MGNSRQFDTTCAMHTKAIYNTLDQIYTSDNPSKFTKYIYA